MVHKSLEAAEQIAREDGAQVRVLDLRTLQPMDDAAIMEAVRACARVLIVHEDTRTAGLAGEITARINEQAFEWLDAPIRRVTALDTPVPYNKNLEAAFLPQVPDIVTRMPAGFWLTDPRFTSTLSARSCLTWRWTSSCPRWGSRWPRAPSFAG
jgi:pyruvate/2-oxoglutarate/acetoin dehydrogenase E1 component